jgi:molybdopterin synthase catalytic subunit
VSGEVIARWPLTGVTVVHHYGRVAPGDNIVLVLTTSAHRQAAFQAAEFLMKYLKVNAPFW